ncbi:MAG: NifB/NifX family molybdenum-iron cluster-binding protein [Ignavibacteria bacterium]|jgi:predicted Fe-Mo cluster-binding NifX family protein
MLSDVSVPTVPGKSRAAKKIAVAIKEPGMQSNLSDVFGRCSYFLLFDTANKTEKTLVNPFAKTFGGAGIQSAHLLIENNVDVLITGNIGINAQRILNSADIKIYKCSNENAKNAIRLFIEDKLDTITADVPAGNGNKHRRRFRYGN